MGKAIGLIFFFVLFVVFSVIKSAAKGAKAAYEAVFDPNAKDERIKNLVGNCMLRVSHTMHEKYSGNPSELPLAIVHLTPVVQSMILEAGYNVPANVARSIVCDAIVFGKHATEDQVSNAVQQL